MSWAWLVPLALGALSALLTAWFGRALDREAERVRLSRLRLAEVRVESRRNRRR